MSATEQRSVPASSQILVGVVACFVLSGFAALLYQTAWMRQFSLAFGTSELAVAAVLSAYMGGLALGAGIAARYVDRIVRPVLFYGMLEAGIAVSALAVPWLLDLANATYIGLFGGQPEPVDASGLGQSAFYLATAFFVLAIPTTFMGATLPLLTKYVVQTEDQVGPRVGLLYATNTIGAVAGTIVAGFLLLPVLGLKGTIYVGVAVNGLVFLLAAMIARSIDHEKNAEDFALDTPGQSTEETSRTLRGSFWILPIMLLSGGNSFVYEVLWTRLLGHILGGSVAAFATMLASFLSGIAIGSAVAARFAKDRTAAISSFIVVQCGIAVASILIYQLLPLAIPESVGLKGNVPVTIFILLPATLFIGATFPLAVRILANDEHDAAPASARVYSWNTVGAIAGATLAAFFLIPALRYEGAIKFAVTINIFLAVGTALLIGAHRRAVTAATVAAAAIVLLVYKPQIPEEILRTSPVSANRTGEMVYYEVGRSATVIVLEESGFFNLRTNGLPEASTNLKGAPPYKHNQRLLTSMTVLARPDTENMLVVGFGAGAALEGVPPSVKSIDAIELEPEVINANRFMSDERQYDPMADERVNIYINDARSALALTDKRYDAIVSQPSHPWTAGASHLYTREYMSLANDHLTEDGVYLQWMNTQFVNEELLKSLCASMLDVFEHVRVYQWDPQVLFFLGSNEPLNVETDMASSGRPLSDDTVHYLEQGVGSVEDVVVALTLDHDNVVAFAADALPITDNFNRMATQSATAMDNKETLTLNKLVEVLQPFDPLLDQNSWIHRDFPVKLNFTYISNRLEGIYLKKRAVALADTLVNLRDPGSLVMIGLGQQRQNEIQQSQRNLLLAIDADPTDHQARYALLRPLLSRIGRNEDLPQRIVDELNAIGGSGATTIRAWLAASRQNWQEVAQLDEELAEIRSTDLWYRDSVKLRADWRIKVKTEGLQPKLAIEAIRLIDNAIALFQDPDFYVMRLAAAYVADDPVNIIETARRVIYLFETEVDRTAAGDVEPNMLSLRAKMLQVRAVEQILDSLANDDRIAPYKVRELETAINRIGTRLQELISDRR